MRRLLMIWIFFIPCIAQAEILSLVDCYKQALHHSEALAIDVASIDIAEAHYKQALGSALPQLSFNGEHKINSTSSKVDDGSNTYLAFTLVQPIFQGLREFRSMKVAKAEQSKNLFAYERAKQLLFEDVAKTYYAILAAEKEILLYQSLINVLNERKKNLTERIEVGRSKSNDLWTIESEINITQANTIAVQTRAEVLRDTLSFFIGSEVYQTLVDEFTVPKALPNLASWQELASSRADVKSSDANVSKVKNQLSYTKSLTLPTLNFTGNAYPYHEGTQGDVNWDVGLKLSVPLFSSGRAKGAVDEYQSLVIQEEQRKKLVVNQVTLEINQAYHKLIGAQKQHSYFLTAEQKSEYNYQQLLKDFDLNQVNHLDVLEALRIWQNQKLQTLNAFYQTKLQYLNLLVASGKLKESDL